MCAFGILMRESMSPRSIAQAIFRTEQQRPCIYIIFPLCTSTSTCITSLKINLEFNETSWIIQIPNPWTCFNIVRSSRFRSILKKRKCVDQQVFLNLWIKIRTNRSRRSVASQLTLLLNYLSQIEKICSVGTSKAGKINELHSDFKTKNLFLLHLCACFFSHIFSCKLSISFFVPG